MKISALPGGWDKSQEARKNPCQVDRHHHPQSKCGWLMRLEGVFLVVIL